MKVKIRRLLSDNSFLIKANNLKHLTDPFPTLAFYFFSSLVLVTLLIIGLIYQECLNGEISSKKMFRQEQNNWAPKRKSQHRSLCGSWIILQISLQENITSLICSEYWVVNSRVYYTRDSAVAPFHENCLVNVYFYLKISTVIPSSDIRWFSYSISFTLGAKKQYDSNNMILANNHVSQ